jgi:hypothetical protein
MLIQQQDDEKPIKSWIPYIIGMTATAILSALGTEAVKWAVDELRTKYGTQKDSEEEKENE